jgi:hypothetical protein
MMGASGGCDYLTYLTPTGPIGNLGSKSTTYTGPPFSMTATGPTWFGEISKTNVVDSSGTKLTDKDKSEYFFGIATGAPPPTTKSTESKSNPKDEVKWSDISAWDSSTWEWKYTGSGSLPPIKPAESKPKSKDVDVKPIFSINSDGITFSPSTNSTIIIEDTKTHKISTFTYDESIDQWNIDLPKNETKSEDTKPMGITYTFTPTGTYTSSGNYTISNTTGTTGNFNTFIPYYTNATFYNAPYQLQTIPNTYFNTIPYGYDGYNQYWNTQYYGTTLSGTTSNNSPSYVSTPSQQQTTEEQVKDQDEGSAGATSDNKDTPQELVKNKPVCKSDAGTHIGDAKLGDQVNCQYQGYDLKGTVIAVDIRRKYPEHTLMGWKKGDERWRGIVPDARTHKLAAAKDAYHTHIDNIDEYDAVISIPIDQEYHLLTIEDDKTEAMSSFKDETIETSLPPISMMLAALFGGFIDLAGKAPKTTNVRVLEQKEETVKTEEEEVNVSTF